MFGPCPCQEAGLLTKGGKKIASRGRSASHKSLDGKGYAELVLSCSAFAKYILDMLHTL